MNLQQEQTLLSNVAVTRREVEHISDAVKKHGDVLYGNSHAGIISKVRVLEKAQVQQKRRNWLALTSTIGLVLAIVSGVIVTLILKNE